MTTKTQKTAKASKTTKTAKMAASLKKAEKQILDAGAILADEAKKATAREAAKDLAAHADATEQAWQDLAKKSAAKAAKPSKHEAMAALVGAVGQTAKAPKAKAAKPAPEQKPRDSRLPAAGTVLTKRTADGKVAECVVGSGNGATYRGVEFTSLSSAARAAAADLCLNVNQNGFLFWGLVKPSASKDPVLAASKAIASMEACLRAAWAAGSDEDRGAIRAMIAAIPTEVAEIIA